MIPGMIPGLRISSPEKLLMNSADAATRKLEHLDWGIKPSFLSYLQGLEDLHVTTNDGARVSELGESFIFPLAARRELSDGGIRLEFNGDLRLKAHGGMLLVILMNPWLTITPDGVELSVVDLMAWPDTSRRESIAISDEGYRYAGNGDLDIPLRLTANGVETFNNVYPEGTVLAPARVRISE